MRHKMTAADVDFVRELVDTLSALTADCGDESPIVKVLSSRAATGETTKQSLMQH